MADTQSRQPRLHVQRGDASTYIWLLMEHLAEPGALPAWGDAARAEHLRALVRDEPILAGAVASLCAKVSALDWQLTGGRNIVTRYHPMLAEAEDGAGWNYLLERWTQDYLITDLGGVLELAREGSLGPVGAIYHVDSARCALTGNANFPLRYVPDYGEKNLHDIPLRPGDFSRIVDMPASSERRLGLGFCGVSRALKSARLLTALYRYEDEQLSDLPPQGVVAITGMTLDEVNTAFDLYEQKNASREKTTFKGVLWLASQASPHQPIDVKVTPFANLPAHLNRTEMVTQYINILALTFGVDSREFWPVSQGPLGTGKEAEIQAQKAKGKGFGKLVAAQERAINWDVLPQGVQFAYDLKDSEDDLLRETIREKAFGNLRKLWEPSLAGEGLLTTEEARRLLVEEGLLPEWVSATYGNQVSEGIAEKAARAGLDRGEDLVVMNRAGEVFALWSSRSYSFSSTKSRIPGREVSASHPFYP